MKTFLFLRLIAFLVGVLTTARAEVVEADVLVFGAGWYSAVAERPLRVAVGFNPRFQG